MKTHLKTIIILLLIVAIFAPTIVLADNDYEDGSSSYGKDSPASGSEIEVFGGADAYQSGMGNGGKKCQMLDLCFSGVGLWMKLIKYDAKTKTETIVGTPILYHDYKFTANEISADVEAYTVKMDPTQYYPLTYGSSNLMTYLNMLNSYKVSGGLNECSMTVEFRYLTAEATNYKKKYIEYCPGDGMCYSEYDGKVKLIQKGEMPLTSTGKLGQYINETLLPSLFTSAETAVDEVQTIFNYKFSNAEMGNLDQFYIKFEVAQRLKGKRLTSIEPEEKWWPWEEDQRISIIPQEVTTYTCGNSSHFTNKPLEKDGAKIMAMSTWQSWIFEYTGYVCVKATESQASRDYVTSCSSSDNACTVSFVKDIGFGESKVNKVVCESRYHCSKAQQGKGYYTYLSSCEDKCIGGTCDSGWYRKTVYECAKEYSKYKKGGCVRPKIDATKTLHTLTYTGSSKIISARQGGAPALIRGLVTPYDFSTGGAGQSKTAHDIYKYDPAKDQNVKTGQVEHYVGPSAKEALVGTSNDNKYKLWDMSWSAPTVTHVNQGYAVGMAVYWLLDIGPGCTKVCANMSGDALLKCAENYCDNHTTYDERWNASVAKRDCIRKQCKYKPVADNCSNLPADSSYAAAKSDIENMQEKVESNCTECDKAKCIQDVTNEKFSTPNTIDANAWCRSDPTNVPADQRTYINVGCTETTDVAFANLSKTTITPGTGVYYDITATGEKKCYIWFDIDTWKFDYASYHSKEEKLCVEYDFDTGKCIKDGELSHRQILEKMIDDYNNAAAGNYTGPIGKSVSSYIDQQEDNTNLQWDVINYSLVAANNKSRIEADVTVFESIGSTYGHRKDSTQSLSLVPISTDLQTATVEQAGTKSAKKFDRLSESNTPIVHEYRTSSSAKVVEGFEKSCISSDGKATVLAADSNGKCQDVTAYGKTEEIEGQNLFYTMLEGINADNYSLQFKGTIKLYPSGTDTEYESSSSVMSNKTRQRCETCDPGDDQDLECNITFEKNSGTTINGGIYNGPNGVTATISYGGKLKDGETIQSYELLINPTNTQLSSASGKVDTIEIKPKTGDGIEEYEVVCIVKTQQQEATNKKPVKVSMCSNATCSIDKLTEDGTKYRLNVASGYSSSNVFMKTSIDPKTKFQLNKLNGEYIFIMSKDYTNTYVTLYGIVETASGSTCCSKLVNPGGGGDEVDCLEDFNPDLKKTYLEVKNYCTENLDKEVHHYDNVETCTNACLAKCPKITECTQENMNIVENFCNSIYTSGTVRARQCINRCYTKTICGGGSGDYLYRPINNENPFPNSYDSEAPYETGGKRQVGANWIAYTDYIKHDDEDSTSVTGGNANKQVEYIIDLTPADVQAIKDDTKNKKKLSKINVYKDYIYGTDLDKDYEGPYYSSFMHDDSPSNGGFKSLFTYIKADD